MHGPAHLNSHREHSFQLQVEASEQNSGHWRLLKREEEVMDLRSGVSDVSFCEESKMCE